MSVIGRIAAAAGRGVKATKKFAVEHPRKAAAGAAGGAIVGAAHVKSEHDKDEAQREFNKQIDSLSNEEKIERELQAGRKVVLEHKTDSGSNFIIDPTDEPRKKLLGRYGKPSKSPLGGLVYHVDSEQANRIRKEIRGGRDVD